MTSDQLKEAYERAGKLSLKNQDMLVKQILKTIEEMEADEKWDALFEDPRSPKLLEKLVNEAHEEYLAGTTKEGGFGRDWKAAVLTRSGSSLTDSILMHKNKLILLMRTLRTIRTIQAWILNASIAKIRYILYVLVHIIVL